MFHKAHMRVHALTTWLVTMAVIAAASGIGAQRANEAVTVRYVANAGALVTLDARTVLIDAPIRDGIPPYATSPVGERQRLEQARPPYDRVDVILVTHWHEDHYSPEAVAAHLSRNDRATLVSSPEVVDRLRAAAPDLPRARLRAVLPAPGESEELLIGDLRVRVLRLRHNPARRYPEQHVGFLIGNRASVLHVGDAEPTGDNFALLRGLPTVDVALLPFWYLLTDANRRLVHASIAPRRIVALHLPPGDAPEVRRTLRAAGVHAALPTQPGTAVTLTP